MIRQTMSSYPRGQKIVTPQVLSLDGYDKFHLPEGYNLKVCFACQHRGRLQKTLYEELAQNHLDFKKPTQFPRAKESR